MNIFEEAARAAYASSDQYNRFARAMRDAEDVYTSPFTGARFKDGQRIFEPGEGPEPRPGFIDAGIILTKGFTLSRAEFEELDAYEWAQLEDWAQSMPNIAVDEIVESKMLWIYDRVPVITSME